MVRIRDRIGIRIRSRDWVRVRCRVRVRLGLGSGVCRVGATRVKIYNGQMHEFGVEIFSREDASTSFQTAVTQKLNSEEPLRPIVRVFFFWRGVAYQKQSEKWQRSVTSDKSPHASVSLWFVYHPRCCPRHYLLHHYHSCEKVKRSAFSCDGG